MRKTIRLFLPAIIAYGVICFFLGFIFEDRFPRVVAAFMFPVFILVICALSLLIQQLGKKFTFFRDVNESVAVAHVVEEFVAIRDRVKSFNEAEALLREEFGLSSTDQYFSSGYRQLVKDGLAEVPAAPQEMEVMFIVWFSEELYCKRHPLLEPFPQSHQISEYAEQRRERKGRLQRLPLLARQEYLRYPRTRSCTKLFEEWKDGGC